MLPSAWITPESQGTLRLGEKEKHDLMMADVPHLGFLQLLAEEII